LIPGRCGRQLWPPSRWPPQRARGKASTRPGEVSSPRITAASWLWLRNSPQAQRAESGDRDLSARRALRRRHPSVGCTRSVALCTEIRRAQNGWGDSFSFELPNDANATRRPSGGHLTRVTLTPPTVDRFRTGGLSGTRKVGSMWPRPGTRTSALRVLYLTLTRGWRARNEFAAHARSQLAIPNASRQPWNRSQPERSRQGGGDARAQDRHPRGVAGGTR
jgi:hypothetical protein